MDGVKIWFFSDVATKIQISLLLSEGVLLANHSHENLLTPLGVCLASGSLRPLLVYPFASYGNLKKLIFIYFISFKFDFK